MIPAPSSEPERPRPGLAGALQEALELWSAAAAASGVFLLVDALCRDWRRFRPTDHVFGASVLYLAVATAIGAAWLAYRWIERALPERLQQAPWRLFLRAALAVSVAHGTAYYAFSGFSVSTTWLGRVGPWLLLLAVALVGAGWAALLPPGRPPSRKRRMGLVALCLGLAAAGFCVDQRVFPFLYDPLHTATEALVWLLLLQACLLLGASRRAQVGRVRLSLGLVVPLVGLSYFLSPSLRQEVDRRLSHTWLEERYVGRMVRRTHELRQWSTGAGSLDELRLADLLARHRPHRTELDPMWLTPTPARPLPPELRTTKNLVVFYVDTLRRDTAHDPKIMPHLAALRARSLDFERAYAVGSDTLRSLPALTGGNQFIRHTHSGDLLRLAETAGYRTHLVATRSAREFLERLRPSFRFRSHVDVSDYDGQREVWGYGGHHATARGIVSEAIDFVGRQGDSPFLLWLLHFDQHAWRELDQSYLDELAGDLGHPRAPNERARYEAVASGIDRQLGRFLAALEESGHQDDTAVLFVSDHGEGLGQEGFWVHSVFLWESLIRVPLVLYVPGLSPHAVATPVSLLDVTPTLAPLFGGGSAIYHGQDLLGLATAAGERTFVRRLPIVLRSATRDRLSRVGVLDSNSRDKLVVRIQAVFPELYDVGRDAFDAQNQAPRRPEQVERLLSIIARSPVFPRSAADFSLLEAAGELDPVRTAHLDDGHLDAAYLDTAHLDAAADLGETALQ